MRLLLNVSVNHHQYSLHSTLHSIVAYTYQHVIVTLSIICLKLYEMFKIGGIPRHGD